MDWLANTWVWIALVIGFIALHAFGHGHGAHRHGRRSRHGADAGAPPDAALKRAGTPADDASAHAPVAAAAGVAEDDRRRGC